MAPLLAGLLFILFGRLLAVWGCICPSPAIQSLGNELVNATEQLMKLFLNLFTAVPGGRHKRDPSGVSLCDHKQLQVPF